MLDLSSSNLKWHEGRSDAFGCLNGYMLAERAAHEQRVLNFIFAEGAKVTAGIISHGMYPASMQDQGCHKEVILSPGLVLFLSVPNCM